MLLAPFRVLARLTYAVAFAFGGFLFAIPKWILFGTRASQQRRKLLKLQRKQLRRQRRDARRSPRT